MFMQITKWPYYDNDTLLFPSLGNHCCWRALCEPAHGSTIARKSQNLSDVSSEVCTVDWFSYYPGCSPRCDNIK